MTQIQAMALSLGVEVPIALALGPRALRTGLAGLAATLITHPVLWLAWFPLRERMPWLVTALALEGAVVAVETLVYRSALALPWRRALLISAVANAASFGVGLLFG